ncbi:MAG: hypothetical protein LBP54_04790 [Campylobacteraceae bacterium]|jgi:hypothetical protein|nr:hypothetical protein [Campylobacteraceae bacterium]
MWVLAKEATDKTGISFDTIHKQIKRGKCIYKYRYVDGKGRGGRKLEIWVDDKLQPVDCHWASPLAMTECVASRIPRDEPSTEGKQACGSAKKECDQPLMREKPHETKQAIDPITYNYNCLTKSKQAKVLERIELVKSYVNRPNWMDFEQWANGKNLPTKAHFFKWVRLYRQGIRNQNVLDLFCDKRGRPKDSLKMTVEMQEMAQRYILRRDIQFQYNACFGLYQRIC